MRFVKTISLVATSAALLGLAACGSSSDSDGADGATTVNWWTWDDKQAVSYQKCVDQFEAENPDITVKISQYAWDDYWTKLTAGFVSGEAPDAFQDHVSASTSYISQNQLLALDDLIAQDGLDLSQYTIGQSQWTGEDGKIYGLPMDWATVAFYYNAGLLADAGLTADDLNNMTWNPDDGGTFEDVVARLTVDENGVRGDEPGFDKTKIATYGVSSLGSGGINGQDTWAQFAATTGWTLGDTDNWPTTFQYSDSRYVATAEYLRGLVDKGYAPADGTYTVGVTEQLGSGEVAMVSGGSWYATTFFALDGVDVAIAPSVIGEDGERAGMASSNGNSIWAGTENQDATWKWVSYMGSEACQSVAGADGTFFPSIAASMDVTKQALADQGIDISAYTDQLDAGTLFVSPMYNNAVEISSALSPLSESFFSGDRDADVFAEMDAQSVELLAEK